MLLGNPVVTVQMQDPRRGHFGEGSLGGEGDVGDKDGYNNHGGDREGVSILVLYREGAEQVTRAPCLGTEQGLEETHGT